MPSPDSLPQPDAAVDPAAPEPATRYRPSARFMLAHPAHFMALGFGSGLSPIAPGTAGTLWAWLAFVVWQNWAPPGRFDQLTGLVILASIVIGWWACTITARNMRVADPGNIVWDEVVAFWIVLWLISPASPLLQVVAFTLFRFFDAVKPGPVAWADSVFKGFNARGGFGILFDDLVAAFCTLLVIAIARAL